MKLVIGTASWGKPYGLNAIVPTALEFKKILKVAKDYGIRSFHWKPEYETPGYIPIQIRKQGFQLLERPDISEVYTEEEVNEILESPSNFNPIQVPLNVFDQRLIKSGCLKRIKEAGHELHVRSIFLQGRLLGDEPRFRNYFDYIENKGVTKLEAAIKFIQEIYEIDYITVGVNSADQLKEILTIVCSQHWLRPTTDFDLSSFAIDDLNVIDPRLWKRI